jgi:hypothetical protein
LRSNVLAVGTLLIALAAGTIGEAIASEAVERNPVEAVSSGANIVYDSATFASLTGIVLDSLHNEPLAGAEISLSNSTRRARTGVDGRFQIDNISSGLHDIIVSHPFADSIGLALDAKGIRFEPGQHVKSAFAIPSERGLQRILCGQIGTPQNHALLVGRVARVGSNVPAANATVELDWIEVGLQPGHGIVNQPRHLTATTNSEGRYVFCNLADSLDVTIRAVAEPDSSGDLVLSLGDKPVGIQYVFLPPARAAAIASDSSTRWAVIRGRVVDPSGRPLDAATVDVIRGVMSTTTKSDGEFYLARAPMGSQLLRVRRLGYEESIQPVTISSTNAHQFNIELSKAVAALDPVVIRARLSDAAVRSGFEKRALTGPGRYLTAQFLLDHKTHCVFDMIQIPGYALRKGTGTCSAGLMPRNRGVSSSPFSGPGMSDRSTVVSGVSIASPGNGLDQCMQLFIDDLEEYADSPSVSATMFTTSSNPGPLPLWELGWLNPKSVVGVEMYTPGTAPMRFPHNPNCALILIWTSHYHGTHV